MWRCCALCRKRSIFVAHQVLTIKHVTEMKQLIQIRCKNNKKSLKVEAGTTLSDIFKQLNLTLPYPPVCAKVNNKVEGLHYRVYNAKDIEYLDISSHSGIQWFLLRPQHRPSRHRSRCYGCAQRDADHHRPCHTHTPTRSAYRRGYSTFRGNGLSRQGAAAAHYGQTLYIIL